MPYRRADLLAKSRGTRIIKSTVPAEGKVRLLLCTQQHSRAAAFRVACQGILKGKNMQVQERSDRSPESWWLQTLVDVRRRRVQRCRKAAMTPVPCASSRLRLLSSSVQDVLKSLRVALGSSDTKFSAALGSDKRIAVTGAVKGAQPYLTRIGTFDVDLALRGNILLVRGVPLPSHPQASSPAQTAGLFCRR